MSRSLEFTTSGPYTRDSHDNAVHDGRIPWREPKDIRIDGEPIVFTDESLHEKLYRTLLATEKLQSRSSIIDCLAFMALMQGRELPSGKLAFHPTVEPIRILTSDTENDFSLALGHSIRSQTRYTHSVVPAHQPEKAFYIYKMGDTEPICLSTLAAAHKIYGTVVAHPIVELDISKC